jgi:hypothetical protein
MVAQHHAEIGRYGSGQTVAKHRKRRQKRDRGFCTVPAEQRQRRRAQCRGRDGPDHDQCDQPDVSAAADARYKRHGDKGRAGERSQRANERAEPADDGGDPVGRNPHRGIGDGEDRLVQHQNQDDGGRRDPHLGGEHRQIDQVRGPAQREHQLQNREIDAGAFDAGYCLACCQREIAHFALKRRAKRALRRGAHRAAATKMRQMGATYFRTLRLKTS